MTGWLKDSRGWLAAQPVVVAVTKPQELRGRDLGQTLVQIFVPILALVLVVGGGIGVVFTGPQTPVPAEEELAAQNIEVAAASEPSELEVFELEDFELEEYHSVSQYSANLEQYRKAISSLRPFKHWQRIRQEQMLSSLEVREWVAVGSAGTELCFQHSKTLECIEIETLETLQESGKEFAEANPQGFGLCYDWLGEVCMSGDWFDSKERFTSVINATREYVMTGEWPVETSELALETSPTYEPARSRPVLEDDLMSEAEWRQVAQTLFPDIAIGDLIITYGFDAESYGGNPEDLPGVEQWYRDNPEAFCIGTADAGDCFTSRAQYEEVMRAQEEWQGPPECNGQEGHPFYEEETFVGCFTSWEHFYQSNPPPAPDDSGSDPAPDDSGGDPAPDDSGSDPAPDDSGS